MSVTKQPRTLPGPLAAQPAPPSRLYSFTDWQTNNPTSPPPGDRMDADYDNTNTVVSQTLSWVATSLNTDGSLKAGSVGQSQMVSGLFDDIAQDIIDEVQPLVDQAAGSAASALASSHAAQASAIAADTSNTAAGGAATTATAAANGAVAARNTAQGYATTAQTAATQAQNADNDAQGAAALAQDYADVTEAWAEHMPDTIPPNILAVMGVTGDHWSARWWANQAATTFGSRQLMQTLLYQATANQTVFPLTIPDLGARTYTIVSTEVLEIYLNGVRLPQDDPNPGHGDWLLTPATSTITFLTPLRAGSMVQVDVLSSSVVPSSGTTVNTLNIQNAPYSQPDGSPPPGARSGDVYINGAVGKGGFLCIAP